MFDENPTDAYENYPCYNKVSPRTIEDTEEPYCGGEVRCLEGIWICMKCEKVYEYNRSKNGDT